MPRNYVRKKIKTWDATSVARAMKDIEDGSSCYAAAKKYSIPYETLRGKVTELHPSTQGRPTTLSPGEEEQIANAFVYLSEAGAPAGRRELAEIVKSYLDNIGRDSRFEDNRPGKDLILGFKK